MFAYCGNNPVNSNDPTGRYFNNSYNDWNYACTDGGTNRYFGTSGISREACKVIAEYEKQGDLAFRYDTVVTSVEMKETSIKYS